MRSYYLDDLPVRSGDKVICKCDMLSQGFTANELYTVCYVDHKTLGLINNEGRRVVPSARFQPLSYIN